MADPEIGGDGPGVEVPSDRGPVDATDIAKPETKSDEENDEEQRWLREGAGGLADIFAKPGTTDAVERVLRRNLAAPPEADLSSRLYNAVRSLIGDEPANFLLTLLWRAADDVEILNRLAPHVESSLALWLRALTGSYGYDVRESKLYEGQPSDGWRKVTRQIYLDRVLDEWLMRLDIVKYDNSFTTVIDAPRSFVLLAQIIIDTLDFLPSDVARDIDDDAVSALKQSYEAFLELRSTEEQSVATEPPT